MLTYRLNAAANVTVEVVDSIGGILATVVDRVWTRAGQHTAEVDGAALADGRYTIVITARTAAGAMVQRLVPLTVTRTLGVVTVTPASFSPNGDGRKDHIALTFSLAAAADVRIRVVRDDRWVASPLHASFLPGHSVSSGTAFAARGRFATGAIRRSSRWMTASGRSPTACRSSPTPLRRGSGFSRAQGFASR